MRECGGGVALPCVVDSVVDSKITSSLLHTLVIQKCWYSLSLGIAVGSGLGLRVGALQG